MRSMKPHLERLAAYPYRKVEAPIKLVEDESPHDLLPELDERAPARLCSLPWSRHPSWRASPRAASFLLVRAHAENGAFLEAAFAVRRRGDVPRRMARTPHPRDTTRGSPPATLERVGDAAGRRFYLTSEMAHLTPEERLKAALKEVALAVARDREPGKSPHRLDGDSRPAWLRFVPSYARELFSPPHW